MKKTNIVKFVSIIASVVMMLGLLPNFSVSAAYENTHKNTGNYAYDIVEVAKTQVGYRETGTNDTKYNRWFGSLPGYGYNYAWCQTFVAWCANQAGVPTSMIPRVSGTISAKDTFKKNGTYHAGPYEGGSYTPKKGDIIYFYSSGSESKHHVGIVSDCVNGIVYTIEGNSSNKVATRQYSVNDGNIRGYGVPFKDVPPTLNFYASTNSLVINGNDIKKVSFSYENYNDGVTISWEHGSQRATTLTWDKWNNQTVDLIIEGYKQGTEVITVYLKDTNTGKILATKYIEVTVTGLDLKFTSSLSSVSINMSCEEKVDVTFSYKNAPSSVNRVSIRWIHGDNAITNLTWGDWSNNTITLHIGGFNVGIENIKVELFDTDTGRVLATKVIEVDVRNYCTIIWDYGMEGYPVGSGSSLPIGEKFGNYSKLLFEKPPTGYTFAGWYYEGEKVDFDTIVPNKATITLNAHWIADEYTLIDPFKSYNIYLDPNGGTCEISKLIVRNGEIFGALLAEPAREGYVFDGWYTEPDGGIEVELDSSCVVTSDMTLYAHWKVEVYTIAFHVDNDNPCSALCAYGNTYGNAFGELPNVHELGDGYGWYTENGYKFAGWYTEPVGGTEFTSDTIITGPLDLYAQWEKTEINNDGNNNDTVTMFYISLLQKHLTQRIDFLNTEQLKLMDVNKDGRVNIFDLSLLKESLKQ